MSKIVTRDAFVRNTTAEMIENRQVEFVISSEAVDSYNTVFKQDGGDLKRFQDNGVVFYMHDSSSSDPDDLLGPGEVYRDGDLLIGKVTFEPENINKKAEKVFRKIQNGTPYMASIGARVIDAEFGKEERGEDKNVLYFTRWELLEFSVVPIGSNPDAHKRNTQTIEELRNAAAKEITVDAPEIVNTRSVYEAQMIINNNKK